MDKHGVTRKCPKGFELGNCDDTASDNCEFSVITGGCCGNECTHCGGAMLRMNHGYECSECGQV